MQLQEALSILETCLFRYPHIPMTIFKGSGVGWYVIAFWTSYGFIHCGSFEAVKRVVEKSGHLAFID